MGGGRTQLLAGHGGGQSSRRCQAAFNGCGRHRRANADQSWHRTNIWYCWTVGKNTSFSLDEHYSAFIDDEVASGRYRSASDVVRSALRLLEDRETQLRAVREALIDGERSGSSTPFDFDAFRARKRAGGPHQ